MTHHHEEDTAFVRRSKGLFRLAGRHQHVVSGGLAVVLSSAISYVVPMLEQWHNESVIADQMAQVEARLTKQIEENKRDQRQVDERQMETKILTFLIALLSVTVFAQPAPTIAPVAVAPDIRSTNDPALNPVVQ